MQKVQEVKVTVLFLFNSLLPEEAYGVSSLVKI